MSKVFPSVKLFGTELLTSCSGGPTSGGIIETYESAPLPPTGLPAIPPKEEKAILNDEESGAKVADSASFLTIEGESPTEEELKTLRKVPGAFPMIAFLMCFIEFAERASYYGSSGIFPNFIRAGLPAGGNGAGAVAPGELGQSQTAGALGLGSVPATALVQMFKFLAYLTPILGGIVADTKWGRFKTICIGTAVGAIAHILLVIPAIPSVIQDQKGSLAAFVISILILAFAAGFIKPSLGPLLCDQSPVRHPTIKVLNNGERVIVDPTVTVQRYLLIFFWAINIGAFFQLATTYAAHDVGFWLAYLTPGIIYMAMPIVLVACYKNLYKAPPQGTVLIEVFKVLGYCFKNGGFWRMFKGGDAFFEPAKPTNILAKEGSVDINIIVWDDKFVDEVRQSVDACAVFAMMPIFYLADGGLGNSENDMTVAMINSGVPNDLISNFNAVTIVVFAPLINYGLYPLLERYRMPLTPMWRMFTGYVLAGLSMVVGAILQWQIYQQSPCGYYGTSGPDGTGCFNADGSPAIVNLSLWLQVPLYSLPAIGEIFVLVTSYEISYTRAPARMKGLIWGISLVTSAVSSAITLPLSPVVRDPYLIWPYIAIAGASFLCAIACPMFFSHVDKPVVFNDIDRMEGRQQPDYIAEHGNEAQPPLQSDKKA